MPSGYIIDCTAKIPPHMCNYPALPIKIKLNMAVGAPILLPIHRILQVSHNIYSLDLFVAVRANTLAAIIKNQSEVFRSFNFLISLSKSLSQRAISRLR